MYSALKTMGNIGAMGLGFVTSAEAGVRLGWRRSPRPMPHQFLKLLEHPWRLAYRNPGETLGLYGFSSGMQVLDAGCGSGLFTTEMARMVGPEGVVHAVDLQYPCVERSLKRVKSSGLSDRVRFHHCGLYELPLADESIDLAVMIATLGEIPDRFRVLDELKRVLKPGGRVAISEEMPDPAYLAPGEVRRSIDASGFRFGGKSGSAFCYSMIFFKDG